MSTVRCRSCGKQGLKIVVDLGEHAWCNDFLTEEQVGKEKKYPLCMSRCNYCSLCQLDFTVPKETMFTEHSYVSGTTKSLKQHFYLLARENVEDFGLHEHSFILDIGGNDGTQLVQYEKAIGGLGGNLYNVESAKNIAAISRQNGIALTFNSFFNEELVARQDDNAIPWRNRFDLINASGVFFHLEELHSVIRGIKLALKDDGVFVVQFMYLGDMIKNTAFDGIYHEHLCYYSLDSLEQLLAPYGLRVFDAYHSDIHGGSIIAKLEKGDNYKTTERYWKTKSLDLQLCNKRNLELFSKRVEGWRDNFRAEMLEKKNSGRKIYGFGAPAKGNTLLTYAGLDNKIIECLFEINPMKYNKFTPVTNIPIIEENHDMIEDNSYILLLSWNFADEIIAKCKDLTDRGCEFILPFGRGDVK